MITVTVSGQAYECTTAVKGSNFIVLYDENDIITTSFFDITDFSLFTISGGDWTPYVKNTVIIRNATLSGGAIHLSEYDDIETGTTIIVKSPAVSMAVTAGISIDGEVYPIVNAMGQEIMGGLYWWGQGALISLLIDKSSKRAYFMNGGFSDATILDVADEKGSAANVQGNLNLHKIDYSNPHGVTAAQVGAIPTTQKGAANGVASLGSDGKVPAAQLPEMDYDPAGSAAGVQTNLTAHENNKNNPHGVTLSQIGAAPAYTYGTTDLEAGTSALATGKLYFVYEE